MPQEPRTPDVFSTEGEQPVFYDVLLAHNPVGLRADEDLTGVVKTNAWVRMVAARNPEEAERRAIDFLWLQRGVKGATLVEWKYSRKPEHMLGVNLEDDPFIARR